MKILTTLLALCLFVSTATAQQAKPRPGDVRGWVPTGVYVQDWDSKGYYLDRSGRVQIVYDCADPKVWYNDESRSLNCIFHDNGHDHSTDKDDD